MDISKIEEAKELFEKRKQILHAFGVAKLEFKDLAKKLFTGKEEIDLEVVNDTLLNALSIYFNGLLEMVEAKIKEL